MWTCSSPNLTRAEECEWRKVWGKKGREKRREDGQRGTERKAKDRVSNEQRKGSKSSKEKRTLILVQPSQISIIPLVQSLILERLKSLLSDLLKNDSEGVVGALKDRGEGDVEVGVTGLLEVLAALEGFGTTLFGEGGVLPSVFERGRGV